MSTSCRFLKTTILTVGCAVVQRIFCDSSAGQHPSHDARSRSSADCSKWQQNSRGSRNFSPFFFRFLTRFSPGRSSSLVHCSLPATGLVCARQRGPVNSENAVSASLRIPWMAMATRSAAGGSRKGDLSCWRPPGAAPSAEARVVPGFLWISPKALSALAASPPNQAENSLFAGHLSYRSYCCWAAPHRFGGKL